MSRKVHQFGSIETTILLSIVWRLKRVDDGPPSNPVAIVLLVGAEAIEPQPILQLIYKSVQSGRPIHAAFLSIPMENSWPSLVRADRSRVAVESDRIESCLYKRFIPISAS